MADPAPAAERLEAHVGGLVQGVGFRWFAVREAARRGLVGWVANDTGGAVNVLAEGPPKALDAFLEALREGPPGAQVRGIAARRSAASGGFSRFEIRPGGHGGD